MPPPAFAAALRRIMQQQLTTGKSLLALAEVSEKAIIEGDTGKLSELVPQQQALLEMQIAQEKARQEAATVLSTRLGLEDSAPLSTLLPELAPADAIALAALRTQILATQRRVESQNDCNRRLLDNALSFVKFNLEALTSAALKPAKYGVNLTRLEAPSFYIDSKA
ncbi:MAG TPA: flagellar protein FlgN [Chthonomonadaceae bacterium]|nr:flagellar protein FlgN [Chthonomonadaceae bacterium]